MKPADNQVPPAPLTPPDCDLRDFAFMPVDVHRLLTSETWILGTGDERAAAMTLWLASWHQVPAGSIPTDDRMLAHLSQSGTKWKKLKAHTLRGWVEAADGRLYHPVVAEKALEAWVEKLAFSLSGSAGNAKRWGVSIETDSTRDRALTAIGMLRVIAPQSKTLKKKSVAVIESASRTESGGDDKRSGGDSGGDQAGSGGDVGNLSGGDRKGQGQGQGELKTKDDDDSTDSSRASSLPPEFDEAGFTHPGAAPLPPRQAPPESTDPAIVLAVALRKLGVDATFTHPAVQDWVKRNVAMDVLVAAVALAREQKGPTAKIAPNYLVPIVDKVLNPPAAPARGTAPSAPPPPPRKPKGNEPKGTDESYDEWQTRVDAYERARRNGDQAA